MLLEHLQPEHHKYLKHYRSFEFLGQELKDVYAASDVLVSRAGAISLAEIDFVRKPSLLIPLGTSASRGDQILNAEAFAQDHDCKIFHQGEFSDAEFLDGLKNLLIHAKSAGVGHPHEDKFQPLTKIISLLESYENRR
jgi:UDP-N-acetylglucosamine--N-acetylmuramyl-(pentapeptide) pyrophosphoryl-undecaprenol N-acetylglucosamine transferase